MTRAKEEKQRAIESEKHAAERYKRMKLEEAMEAELKPFDDEIQKAWIEAQVRRTEFLPSSEELLISRNLYVDANHKKLGLYARLSLKTYNRRQMTKLNAN